jgi:DNA-binding NarL/FixJ family response regulator
MNAEQIAVVLHATDSITRAGVTAALRSRPEIRLVEPDEPAPVALVVLERLDGEAQQLLRRLQAPGSAGIVLVAGDIADPELLNVVSSGVSAVIRRSDATPDTLVRLVKATAAGQGALPPDLLGRLLDRVSRLQRNVLNPNGWTMAGMSDRETEVLRLIAEGLSNPEIAARLVVGDETVKSHVSRVLAKLGLRDRTQAVVAAYESGLVVPRGRR